MAQMDMAAVESYKTLLIIQVGMAAVSQRALKSRWIWLQSWTYIPI